MTLDEITQEQIEPYLYKEGKDGPVKPDQCALERPGYVNYHHYQCHRAPVYTIAGYGVCSFCAFMLARRLGVEHVETKRRRWKVEYEFGQAGIMIAGGCGHVVMGAETFDEVAATAAERIKETYGFSAVWLRSIVLLDEPQIPAPPPGQMTLF